MKITVISTSKEVDKFTESDLNEAKVFSGKNAGICYMKDDYFNSYVSDNEKALKRFGTVAGTNHHSIADHIKVEVLFEGISKMLAIVLNSLQDCAVSEKSGRYTEMRANGQLEADLYNKWRGLFKDRILELYPDIDDEILMKQLERKGYKGVSVTKGVLDVEDAQIKECLDQIKAECQVLSSVKLAQENARYILSVFTKSTTMGYTTSIRQWNYIYDWCQKYLNQFKWNGTQFEYKDDREWSVSYFEIMLYHDLSELSYFIKKNLYIEELRDPKDRCFDFLTQASGHSNHPMSKYHVVEPDFIMGDTGKVSEDDYLGVTYSVSYPASLAHVAQAERHRTLKHYMLFNASDSRYFRFYVPKCIRGTALEKQWLDDLDKVSHLVPQATQVGFIETGHVSDFILKCEERLCGRAQLEITEQTEKTAKRFIDAVDSGNASEVLKCYVDKLRNSNGEVKTKCAMLSGCKESCKWCKNGTVFTRLV